MVAYYFDITDLLAHLAAHGGVTGIQRVEVRLLAELARLPAAEETWCVVADSSVNGAGSGYFTWRLSDIFAHDDEIEALLSLLMHRSCRQSWLIKGLARLRLVSRRPRAKFEVHEDSPYVYMDGLPHGAVLVLPGAGWNNPSIVAAARRHARYGGRIVHVVYDLIPHVHPEYFDHPLPQLFRRHFVDVSKYTSTFICISKHTQADLKAFLADYGRHKPSKVVPLAHEFAGYNRNARECRPSHPEVSDLVASIGPFLLCVGTLEVRKNGVALLIAWLMLQSSLGASTPHLIFCGRRGWKMETFYNMFSSHSWLTERVHILHHVDDADIAMLHEHSVCSIYPSLYEGWGLPVGEAAWFGRTCITSEAASLPEVCENLVDYIDPHNPASIAAAVEQLVRNPSRRIEQEAAIRAATLRTWRNVAEDFREAIAQSVNLESTSNSSREAGSA